jgi:FKBP-type peptidyl-prolyl cis-trans isomerase SlyD
LKTSRGTVVTLRYTLTDDAGEVLDRSGDQDPLVYLHGYDTILPALERHLEGAEVGHRSQVTLPAADAYGERDPHSVFEAPREQFPDGARLRPGMEVTGEGPEGPVTLTVVRVTEGGAVLDANHPLAGKTLHFELEIVGLRAATPEEMEHGHVHDESGSHHHRHDVRGGS